MDGLTFPTVLDSRIEAIEVLLRRLPEQLSHIHSTIRPSGVLRMDPNGGGRGSAQLGYAPLAAGAVDACDTVFAALAEWVQIWADVQSIRPPRFDAWMVRYPSEAEPHVEGLPGGISSRGVFELVSLLEAFLRGQHLRMRHHAMFDEYLEVIEGLHEVVKPWPLDAPPAHPRYRECPTCGHKRVHAVVLNDGSGYAECLRCGVHFTPEETP